MTNGSNFTDETRAAIQAAGAVACERGHDYVGTEHLLIALIRGRSGTVAAALRTVGADPDAIVVRIDSVIEFGRAELGEFDERPYTSRAKKVLELAMMSAREHERADVDPIFLLHGLIREGKGIAAQVLGEAGVNAARLPELHR